MNLTIALAAVLAIAVVAAWIGYSRSTRLRTASLQSGARLHSLPVYHGAYAAIWAALPALLLLALWTPVQSNFVDQAVLASPEGQALPSFQMQRESILSEAREIARGDREAGFNPESTTLVPRFIEADARFSTIGGAMAILLALGAAWFALRRTHALARYRRSIFLRKACCP